MMGIVLDAFMMISSEERQKSNITMSGIPSLSASYQSAVRTQNKLQDYLNQTIQDMAPLGVSLKDTEQPSAR